MKSGYIQLMFIRATPTDQAEVLSWIQRYYEFDHIPFESSSISAALAPLLKDDTYGAVFLAQTQKDRGPQTVGYFVVTLAYDIEYGGRHATVTDLFFDPNLRGTGLGTEAMRFIESWCANRQIATLFLQVEIYNTQAQTFYQKMGFNRHERYTMTKKLKAPSVTQP